MKTIELTKNKFALVNDKDYEFLNQFKWYCAHGYAVRSIYGADHKPYQLRMHRLLLDTHKGMDTDHIDRNPLNNQRVNLRICTRSQNVANTFVEKQNKSGYKGVSWKKANRKWCVQIRVNNIVIHIRLFIDIKKAATAYNKAAIKYFGKFAVLNNI